MTNRELLNVPKESLGPLDQQRQHVLCVELTPMPCPACREPVNALSAAGIDVHDFAFGAKEPDYACPHCQAQLEKIVPVIAVGPTWRWQLKAEWLTDMLAKARAYDREKKANQ